MGIVIIKTMKFLNQLSRKAIKEIFLYYRSYLCAFDLFKLHKSQSLLNNQASLNISTVIFSKDRAMQLHALLCSYFQTKVGSCNVKVIYCYSNELHKKSYDQLRLIFNGKVDFFVENEHAGFQACLRRVIAELPKGKMFFLVDDIIFTESVDYDFLASLDLSKNIFSLRMGNHLNYSYVVDSQQQLPINLKFDDFLLRWDWVDGMFDWAYPLSVDGHLFITDEVSTWVNRLDFNSPSSLESALQKLRFIYLYKSGMSFIKSRIVNIPANKVQCEVQNLHGSIHQDQLLQLWLDGMAIDHSKLRGFMNNSVHQEVDFNFIKRESIV